MTPLDHNNVAKVYKHVLKRALLPGVRLYDLRHTYASLLLAEGAPISFVSHQLGHRSPDTTLRFYTRSLPSTGKSFAGLVDRRAPSATDGRGSWHQNRNRGGQDFASR